MRNALARNRDTARRLGFMVLVGAVACSKSKHTPHPTDPVEPVPSQAPPLLPAPRQHPNADAEANTSPSAAVAEPMPYDTHTPPARALTLEVGDGWGCAVLHD